MYSSLQPSPEMWTLACRISFVTVNALRSSGEGATAAIPIHWPFQSLCFSSPISKLPGWVHVNGCPCLSQTRTFQ